MRTGGVRRRDGTLGVVSARSLLRRALLACAGGVALFAAHPPLRQGWLGLLALVPLAALARELSTSARPVRAAFGWGTLAGLVFFLPLLRWIVHIQEWVAWPLLALVEALFVGAFLALVTAWGPRRWRPAVVVVAWVAMEALRSVLPLGGFGWGILGYTQANGGGLLEVARVLGVLGVSAACAGVAAGVEETLHRVRTGAGRATAAAPALAALAVVVGGLVVPGPPEPTQRTIDIAGIQGFETEGSTGRELTRSIRIAEGMREATARAVAGGRGVPDLTVWPENAVDGDHLANPQLGRIVADALAVLDGGPLLTGAIEDGPAPRTHRNSMLLLDGDLAPADRYVKQRLVPFGEYVPARALLGWYPALARVPSDGIPGTEPRVIDAAGARVGVGICFDVVFPRLFHAQVRRGADVLVLATNNASYGRTAMSDQHIAFSQLRAVETGRWVVHTALSGRSAIVDPQGRVSQRTGLYEQAVIRADVPLVTGLTPATRVGDGVGYAAVALTALGLGWGAADRRAGRRRVALGLAGHSAPMSDIDHEPEPRTTATTREEVGEDLDARDPLPDDTTEGREEDRAFEGNASMEGQQPSS
jgi:apolipoprotein N-acyltransferase